MLLQATLYKMPEETTVEEFMAVFNLDPVVKAFYAIYRSILAECEEAGDMLFWDVSVKDGQRDTIEVTRLWKTKAAYDAYKAEGDSKIKREYLEQFYADQGISVEETVQEV